MTTSNVVSGHSASSGNAVKTGIYSNRLLAGEDPQVLEETTQALVADYGVKTFSGKRLCSDLAMVMLKQDRLERHLQQLSQTHLAKLSTRVEICRSLGIDSVTASNFPEWIFTGDDAVRVKSRWIRLVQRQARHLYNNHSANLMHQIQQTYPELWDYVTEKNSAKVQVYTFSDMLSQYSKQSDPRLRIKDLIDHISNSYSVHLQWAESEQRFEQVLAGSVAQCRLDALVNPNFQRGVALLERRQSELIEQILHLEMGIQKSSNLAIESIKEKPKPESK
jgi:hypothetical protein